MDMESQIGLFNFTTTNGPGQPGKLRYTNRGPWLVLAKTGPVTYKIQRHPQADPEIVHVDKWMPYYPDFGERLQSWIETDCPMQYRQQEVQTPKPVLQDQAVATVDIPRPILDPVPPPPELAEPHPDAPSLAEEPDEMNETHTASPTEQKFNSRCWKHCRILPLGLIKSRSLDHPMTQRWRQPQCCILKTC